MPYSLNIVMQIRAMQAEIQEQRKLLELEHRNVADLETEGAASALTAEGQEAAVREPSAAANHDVRISDDASSRTTEPPETADATREGLADLSGSDSQGRRRDGAERISRGTNVLGMPQLDGSDLVATEVSSWATQLLTNFSRLGRSAGAPCEDL
jgi:hypothetical protein